MTEERTLPPEPSGSRSVGEASGCPTSETLSTYLEGGLDAAVRAQVEDHVSRCEDCYFLVRETLLSLPARDEPGQALPKADPRPRRHLLAIAAMLVASLGSGAAWWLFWRDAHAAAVAGLVKEVRDRRFFEARLTGGFRHGPIVGVKRAARSDNSDQWGVLGAVVEVRETTKATSPEAVRALASAHLLYSKIGHFKHEPGEPDPRRSVVDDAVGLLETLAREHPEDAGGRCDLAAAYLVRAEGSAQGDDAQKALDAADTAIRLDPTLREAHFNRALALEALQRTDDALRAWEAYRSAFPGDDWLPAVAAHLERLRRKP